MISQKFAEFEAAQTQIQGTLRGLVGRNASASVETADSKLQAAEKEESDDGAIQQVCLLDP